MEVFADTFIPPDLQDVWAGTRRCPNCVWVYLRFSGSLDQVHWICPSCGHCWHLEHGHLRPVDPVACHGCTARAKRDCITLMQHDIPRFTAGTPTDVGLVEA